MYDLLLFEIFMALWCIWQLQMGKDGEGSSKGKIIFSIAGLVVAIIAIFVTLYINSPSGFTLSIYPNTEVHACIRNGQFILEPPEEGIRNFTLERGFAGFEEQVNVTDIRGEWWFLGRVIKPYRKYVTLYVKNGPPGIDISLEKETFRANVQENSNVMGVPPFNSRIVFRLVPNATLAYGTHYITIEGIGQDGAKATCTLALKVGESCEGGGKISIDPRFIGNNNRIWIGEIHP